MGNQWDGGPMRWGTIGIGRWWGDEWKGGPMRWGTSDMGDQWDGGPMSSNNVLGDQWVGGPMRRGPMRWGTNEMGDQWADPPADMFCPSHRFPNPIDVTGTETEYQSDVGSTKDTTYLALTAIYGVYFVNICDRIDRDITAPHCIYIRWIMERRCPGIGVSLSWWLWKMHFLIAGFTSRARINSWIELELIISTRYKTGVGTPSNHKRLMINYFANQSQTRQLLKNILFLNVEH